MLTPTHAPAVHPRRDPLAALLHDVRPAPPLYMDSPEPIARLYDAAAPGVTPLARYAWRALADHSVLHAAALREALRVTEVADASPYGDASAMFADMDAGHVLVSTANCEHPVWTPAQSVAFRLVHDHCHYLTGGGFDWRGEQQACRAHAHRLPAIARAALWTECLGQTGYALARGGFGPPKAALIGAPPDAPGWARDALAEVRRAP